MPSASSSIVNRFRSLMNVASKKRRVRSAWCDAGQTSLETFESRALPAATVYGTWSLTLLPPDIPPVDDPGPYLLVINEGGTFLKHGKVHASSNDFGTVHIPGEGGVALSKIKVSKDGQSVKAKIKSDPFKGKLEAQLSENQSEIEATLKFIDKSVKLSEDFKLKGPQTP